MADWLLNALQAMWRWIVDVASDLWAAAFDGFITTLPVFDGTTLEPFADGLSIANQYLPLDACIALLVGYWAFVAGFIVVKYIIKAIPTVG